MIHHSAVLINTRLQPGATARVTEFKTVETVCRSFSWLSLTEVRC
jgi:hypothetical protein